VRKADHRTTGILIEVMYLEAALGLCGWHMAFMKIIVTAPPDGVPVRFAIGKRYGVNQEAVADFEEDADF